MTETACRLLACAALAVACLAPSRPTLALSCAPPRHDASAARAMFGPAKLVFVGRLSEITGEQRHEIWHASTMGTFGVERVFKGSPESRQPVRINTNLRLGQTYLVYADETKGELRADGPCGGKAIALPADGHLSYLTALPAEGSGGIASVYVYEEPFRIPKRGFEIALEGPGGVHRLTTDNSGMATTTLPAGTYRVLTTPPTGFRFDCAGPCDSLRLHDRGSAAFGVTLRPLGKLSIDVRDASGKRLDLLAEFVLFDGLTGQRIRPFSDNASDTSSGHYAAAGRLVPGIYVIALALTETTSDDLFRKVVSQRIVFDGGAPNVERAKRVPIVAGDNNYTFTLPPDIRPVRTELKVEGATEPVHLSLALVIADRSPPSANTVSYFVSRPQGHPDRDAIWSLPGQTWQVASYSWVIEGSKNYRISIRPTQDGTVVLKMGKAP